MVVSCFLKSIIYYRHIAAHKLESNAQQDYLVTLQDVREWIEDSVSPIFLSNEQATETDILIRKEEADHLLVDVGTPPASPHHNATASQGQSSDSESEPAALLIDAPPTPEDCALWVTPIKSQGHIKNHHLEFNKSAYAQPGRHITIGNSEELEDMERTMRTAKHLNVPGVLADHCTLTVEPTGQVYMESSGKVRLNGIQFSTIESDFAIPLHHDDTVTVLGERGLSGNYKVGISSRPTDFPHRRPKQLIQLHTTARDGVLKVPARRAAGAKPYVHYLPTTDLENFVNAELSSFFPVGVQQVYDLVDVHFGDVNLDPYTTVRGVLLWYRKCPNGYKFFLPFPMGDGDKDDLQFRLYPFATKAVGARGATAIQLFFTIALEAQCTDGGKFSFAATANKYDELPFLRLPHCTIPGALCGTNTRLHADIVGAGGLKHPFLHDFVVSNDLQPSYKGLPVDDSTASKTKTTKRKRKSTSTSDAAKQPKGGLPELVPDKSYTASAETTAASASAAIAASDSTTSTATSDAASTNALVVHTSTSLESATSTTPDVIINPPLLTAANAVPATPIARVNTAAPSQPSLPETPMSHTTLAPAEAPPQQQEPEPVPIVASLPTPSTINTTTTTHTQPLCSPSGVQATLVKRFEDIGATALQDSFEVQEVINHYKLAIRTAEANLQTTDVFRPSSRHVVEDPNNPAWRDITKHRINITILERTAKSLRAKEKKLSQRSASTSTSTATATTTTTTARVITPNNNSTFSSLKKRGRVLRNAAQESVTINSFTKTSSLLVHTSSPSQQAQISSHNKEIRTQSAAKDKETHNNNNKKKDSADKRPVSAPTAVAAPLAVVPQQSLRMRLEKMRTRDRTKESEQVQNSILAMDRKIKRLEQMPRDQLRMQQGRGKNSTMPNMDELRKAREAKRKLVQRYDECLRQEEREATVRLQNAELFAATDEPYQERNKRKRAKVIEDRRMVGQYPASKLVDSPPYIPDDDEDEEVDAESLQAPVVEDHQQQQGSDDLDTLPMDALDLLDMEINAREKSKKSFSRRRLRRRALKHAATVDAEGGDLSDAEMDRLAAEADTRAEHKYAKRRSAATYKFVDSEAEEDTDGEGEDEEDDVAG